jgi:hypothetical protein
MRDFLDVVAYCDENPTMAELPQRLNRRFETRRGFEAQSYGNNDSLQWKLRDFFNSPVNPDSLVILESGQSKLSSIIPQIKATFFDDYHESLNSNPDNDTQTFVEVTRTGTDIIGIVHYGNVEPSTEKYQDIINFILKGKSKGARKESNHQHVFLLDLFNATMDAVGNPESDACPDEDHQILYQVHDVVKAVNDLPRHDIGYLHRFVPHWHHHSSAEWQEIIQQAYDKCVKLPTQP